MKYQVTRRTTIEESCIIDADTAEQAEKEVKSAYYKDTHRIVTVEIYPVKMAETATGIHGSAGTVIG